MSQASPPTNGSLDDSDAFGSRRLWSDRLPRRWVVATGLLLGVAGLVVAWRWGRSEILPATVLGAPAVAYFARDFGDELFSGLWVGTIGGTVFTLVLFVAGVARTTLVVGSLSFALRATAYVSIGTFVIAVPAFSLGTALGATILGGIARRLGIKWS